MRFPQEVTMFEAMNHNPSCTRTCTRTSTRTSKLDAITVVVRKESAIDADRYDFGFDGLYIGLPAER